MVNEYRDNLNKRMYNVKQQESEELKKSIIYKIEQHKGILSKIQAIELVEEITGI